MESPSIYLQNIEFRYQSQLLFKKLNLIIQANKITCILGASGIGKTSLLRIIAGLQAPIHGRCFSDNASPLREQIAFMQQTDLLLPWATALDNVLIGIRLRRRVKKSDIEKAKQLLASVGLQHQIPYLPEQLSIGMRQRVALARTLMEEKPVILMDEPFSAVDAITRFELQNLAAEFLKNKTVVLVTHDLFEALRLSDTIYVMSGEPATLKLAAELVTVKPRDLNNGEIQQKQAELFDLLKRETA